MAVEQLCAVPEPDVSEQGCGMNPLTPKEPSAEPLFKLTFVPPELVPQVGQEIATVLPLGVATMGLAPVTDVSSEEAAIPLS